MRALFVSLFVALAALGAQAQTAPAPAPANQTPRDLILAPKNTPLQVKTAVPRGYALIVGVSQYKNLDDSKQLKFPESDADAQEVLQEAGVSWKVYVANDGGQGYNVLGNMAQYNQAPHTSPLYQNGTALTPVGQFEYDAQNDQLPTVSWLMTNNSGNEHPASMPAGGAALIAS